ncbi:hypothetical protein K501DRAFT_289958 [Backusella circina FSU 941]|nr:hypothetical protein K501DRAFT_289958 [Backusella circina FSU 941]
MAPLKAIVAGLPRTGTDSLRTALDILGYRTMHSIDLFSNHTMDPDLILEAYRNRQNADWDKVYEKYDAAADVPVWLCYKELVQKYPDAKVILTLRDPVSWYKSYLNIKNDMSTMKASVNSRERLDKIFELYLTVLADNAALSIDADTDEETAKRDIPSEKLLQLELGEGWERLCAFLGKDIPDSPFPHTNSKKKFGHRVEDIRNDPTLVQKATG